MISDPVIFEAPGQTLFIFEDDLVRVLGLDGTEALFPVSDLEAFVASLALEPT